MTIVNPLDPRTITLRSGKHNENSEQEWCVMEAVAYVAGEPWSDHPQCVSPIIGAFARTWNDDLDDAGRQRLAPYIPKMIGTANGPAADQRRAWMCTDWMVRVYLPAWLDLAGMAEQATLVRAFPTLDSPAAANRVQVELERTRKAAVAAWAAAWAAARDAAGVAARYAAGDAARYAAGDAARAAARAAARDAAGAAAWDAAGAAARVAARAAAGDALRPTVVSLQASALDLLDRMCGV